MARNHYELQHGTTDLTDKIISIDKFTDAGTGEVASAKVTLDARYDLPTFEQFDEFTLSVWPDITSEKPGTTYSRKLFLDTIAPQKNEQGVFVSLDLVGREHYLQKMFFTGNYTWQSFPDMVDKIISYWNTNKGSTQPEIENDSSIPGYTFGTFDFGDNVTAYDALMDIVSRLELPVAAGGGGEPYTLTFSDDGTKLKLHIRPLGHTDSGATISAPMSLSEVKRSIQGNIVRVKGSQGSGSIPSDVSNWQDYIEEYENLPLWKTEIDYVEDVYVRYTKNIFICIKAHKSSDANKPDPDEDETTEWRKIGFAYYRQRSSGETDENIKIVDDFQYSPWTHDKATLFKNYGGGKSNADGNTFTLGESGGPTEQLDLVSFPDSNLVIRDGKLAWRSWVDFKVDGTTSIPQEYLYRNRNSGNLEDVPDDTTSDAYKAMLYSGMRILIGDSKPDFLVGDADKFGNSWINALAQYDGNEWIVFRVPEAKDQCAVMSEGRMYMYRITLQDDGTYTNRKIRRSARGQIATTSVGGWTDISKNFLGADCFHRPYSIKNVPSLLFGSVLESNQIENNGTDPDVESLLNLSPEQKNAYFEDSAIEIVYKTDITESILNAFRRFLTDDAVQGVVTTLIPATNLANAVFSFFTGDDSEKVFTDSEKDALYTYGHFEDVGWWVTLFEVPYPKTTANGIGEPVGKLFGGTKDNKVPLFDMRNLTKTREGETSYGSNLADELSETDGISFLFRFDITGINVRAWSGNIGFRCAIYDIYDSVWVSDVSVRFQEETQIIDLPWTSFTLYRARAPFTLDLETNIGRFINPELKVTEIFKRSRVKRIVFHYLGPYNDQGVFDPVKLELFIDLLLGATTKSLLPLNMRFIGTIDALRFTSRGTAIAKDNTDERHIDAPQRNYPGISNGRQLQKAADAELTRAKFEFDNWTAKVPGRIDIKVGQIVNIQDSEITGGTAIPLFVRKVTYTIGDRGTGSGFVTTLDLYKFRE